MTERRTVEQQKMVPAALIAVAGRLIQEMLDKSVDSRTTTIMDSLETRAKWSARLEALQWVLGKRSAMTDEIGSLVAESLRLKEAGLKPRGGERIGRDFMDAC